MYPIKFELKYEPTNLKQVAKWPYWFGITLLLLAALTFMLGQSLPLELFTVYLFEFANGLIFHLITLGVILTSFGYVLDRFSWRSGEFIFNEDCIDIIGKKSVNIPFDTIKKVRRMDSSSKLIHIDTTHYNVKFKFKQHRDFKVIRTLLDYNPVFSNKNRGMIDQPS